MRHKRAARYAARSQKERKKIPGKGQISNFLIVEKEKK